MKQTLLKHYGKILLTILVLGMGSYFNVDVSKAVTGISTYFDTPAVIAPATDAGP